MPFIISLSCSNNKVKNDFKKIDQEIAFQTVAAFKSAEHIYENEWKLIFRKLDDCQYILFYTDINKLNTFRDNLVISSENGYVTNPDFVNLRFNIYYSEETAFDTITGENAIINRLKNINRSQSDRFAKAGFENDVQVDDFIINLKKFVKNDSVLEISNTISYPLNLTINKKKKQISDPKSLVNEYTNIFNKKVKNAILNQPIADVKVSVKGIIIGNGEILINRVEDKICITSINTQ